VYCATPDEVARFDDAFDGFFFGAQGIAQPALAARHTRPGRQPPQADRKPRDPSAVPKGERSGEDDATRTSARERNPVADETAAERWQTLRARYSRAAGRAPAPEIAADGLDAMLAAATRLIAGVRIARSRRRVPRRDGDRIDLRRTLRASVGTAGDPVDLRRTARALRSARFIVLIDGSRSAAEHAGPALQFAYALLQRSRRAEAFVFSTALRDVTRELRTRGAIGRPLGDLGEAWGGGTRIGDNLLAFVREHGARLLSPETLVFIFSDGLDTGNLEHLARAMRELKGRSAAIVWLHPHAGTAGFTASTRAMRTALPYLRALRPARDEADFARLARVLGRASPRMAAVVART
jgi:uncharacterized protein with von Willebrand factor type A (vWA) domain